MSAVDIAAFFIPLVIIGIIWVRREHFLRYKLSGVAVVALTIVAIFHFDVGMLTTDPYDEFLDSVGAPGATWRASIFALLALSYWGDLRENLRSGGRRLSDSHD